ETTDTNEEPSTEETTDTNEEPSTEEITDTGDKTMWIEKETANSQDKNYSFETTKKEEASKENNKGRLPSTGEKAGTFLSVLGGLSLFGFVLVYVYRKLKIVK
ncbi:LPXTG cell wall anchor domain-containing protein, partial [Enterococcus faecalis]|uniref:LPXTG cell wall anchor domain-containing protein n=1 Tax=Enterococcus faecalis TaxID=1351 RepID=UPI003CC66A4A